MRIRVSRTKTTELSNSIHYISIGASYTHIKSLKEVISPETTRIVMYHAMLESLEGLEVAQQIQHAYLGFNRIRSFQRQDAKINVDVLDLVGNPISSLEHVPRCKELIVSGTLIENLKGVPEGVEIIRCGHSTHLKSLEGCPSTVKIIECSCAPNLKISFLDLPAGLEELLTNNQEVAF